MEAASLNSNDREIPIIVVKEHVNDKGNPNSLNLRAANQNFDKLISRLLENRQVETKKVDYKYINLLVKGNVLSQEHAEIIKQTSKLVLSAEPLYLLLKEGFQDGKFDLHSALGIKGEKITSLSDVLNIKRIASLLSSVKTVTAFVKNMPIMIQAANSQKNWEETLYALQQKPVNDLIRLGFDGIEELIQLANLKQGLPILGTVEKYMTEVVKTGGDILDIKHMSIQDLIKMFNPNNWENLKSTLMNESIQGYLNKGKLGLDLILKLAGSNDRVDILKGMDELVKETEKALDLDLDELSFKQIKDFFTAERTTEEKAQVVFEGIKKAVDLGMAIYKFLDKLDGVEDGQVNCGKCIMF